MVSKGAPLASAGSVLAQISVPNSPHGLLALPGAVWVAAHHSDSVYRIATASNKVVAHVVVAPGGNGQPARMTFGDGTLFAENYSDNAVSLIDPSLNIVTSVVHGPLENCCQPAYGAGALWLLEFSSSSGSSPVRIDPSGQRPS